MTIIESVVIPDVLRTYETRTAIYELARIVIGADNCPYVMPKVCHTYLWITQARSPTTNAIMSQVFWTDPDDAEEQFEWLIVNME